MNPKNALKRQKLDTVVIRASNFVDLGSYQAAADLIEPYLQLYPNDFNILFLMGSSFLGLKSSQKALIYLLRAEKINPNNKRLLNNIGGAYNSLGDKNTAIIYYNKAIALDPKFTQAQFNLGNVYMSQMDWLNAIQCYANAIQYKHDYADAYGNLSLCLINLKKYNEAIDVCDVFIKQNKFSPKVVVNKCRAIFDKGFKANAIQSIEDYIQLNPGSYELHTVAADMYVATKNYNRAVEHFNKSIEINPLEYANFNNLGILYMEAGQHDLAINTYKKSIELNPQSPIPHQNIANIYNQRKEYQESLKFLTSAARLDPKASYIQGMIVNSMIHICDWEGIKELIEKIQKNIGSNNKISNPFVPIAYLSEQSQLTKIAKDWIDFKCPKSDFFSPFENRIKNQKIKIGYYSADFHAHATALLMAGFFEHHNRSKFEVYAFSFGPDGHDDLSKRIRSSFDHFVDVRQLSDRAIAAYSRELNIDIAIDLKGFTQDSRTGIFAERAAPIQINYLGFPGSMGAPYIDYIIADDYVIPANLECNYTERVLRMPNCYQPNDRLREVDGNQQTRDMHQLPENAIVLCSFNNNYKITPEIFSVWMRVLNKHPQAVLWLLKDNAAAEQNLKNEAELRGVDPSRLIFAARVKTPQHLARQKCADLFLDTYPCNAHTTASDALWVGLPLVTCSGNSFASRVAGSLLKTVGLESLITQSVEEYESKILELLTNPEQLTKIRKTLEATKLFTPLFDTEGYTRDFEDLILSIHKKTPTSSH
jgi:predicted O-linked N-acetylglucosamine transferase (SPINDLY family)